MSRGELNQQDSNSSEKGSMRLDLFLKQCRLIPRRTLARAVCDQGGIWVNGQVSKGSKLIKVGDLIQWRRPRKVTTVKVLKIPMNAPAKKDAVVPYELLGREDLS